MAEAVTGNKPIADPTSSKNIAPKSEKDNGGGSISLASNALKSSAFVGFAFLNPVTAAAVIMAYAAINESKNYTSNTQVTEYNDVKPGNSPQSIEASNLMHLDNNLDAGKSHADEIRKQEERARLQGSQTVSL